MDKRLTFTAAGDVLAVRNFSNGYEGMDEVASILAKGECRVGNLEVTLTEGDCFPSAFSGGTWVTADPSVLEDILAMGFNCLGTANNHTLDYSYDGLYATLDALKKSKVAFCGSGMNLFEASKPALLDFPQARVGVISVSSTFNIAAKAGEQSATLKGRPGLNYLRYSEEFGVSKSDMASLKTIANKTGINLEQDVHVRSGFGSPAPEGSFWFGGKIFKEAETPGRSTKCNADDLIRIKALIEDTLLTTDYVVVLVHSHEMNEGRLELQADFLEEFARACVDSGCSAVVGSGAHELRGLEIYKGKPIFYSLGNFIFENSYVRKLPFDFMENLHISKHLSASGAISERSRLSAGAGLDQRIENYLTVIPYFSMEGDSCKELKLYPLALNTPGSRHADCGLPRVATEAETTLIVQKLEKLSSGFGTRFSRKDGYIEVIL